MQTVVTAFLLVVLAASVAWFAVLGLLQRRRARELELGAYEREFRFSAADPFQTPRRYRQFAVVAGGHSAFSRNVTYGRVAGWPMRAFDFRYEVGHGTRREMRHYGLLAIETDLDLPDVVMWNEADAAWAPLSEVLGDGKVACWSYRGDDHLGRVLADAAVPLAGARVSLEARQGVILLAKPLAGGDDPYGDLIERAGSVAEAVGGAFGREAPSG